MNIYVIENNQDRHEQLVLLLKSLYPSAKVYPRYSDPCRNWRQARRLADATPSNGELIFILDLALEGDDPNDATIGIENSRRIRLRRPNAILIAATAFVPLVHSEDAQEIFDAVLDKQHISWKRERDLRNLLKTTIDNIRQAKSGIKSTVLAPVLEYRDSLGIRLVEAIIGIDAIRELVTKSSDGWSDVKVEAISAGFSGSHILRLSGHNKGRPAGLVLKIATKRELLQPEAEVAKSHSEELHVFGGCINDAVGGVRQLGDKPVFYIILASLPGKSLFQLFEHGPKAEARAALTSLLDMLVEQYTYAAETYTGEEVPADQCFSFRPDHPHRVYDSCNDLEIMSETLARRREWPLNIGSPRTIFKGVRRMAKRWSDLLKSISVPFLAFQHGDLHAGNVLVLGNQLKFIDFGRIGQLAVGYDISRLATQARVFFTDRHGYSDWISNGLRSWVQDEFAAFNATIGSQGCPWATQCDLAYQRFIETRPTADRRKLQQIYEAATLSDLLRILSYQNISAFKRIWAAVACWQLGNRLDLLGS